MELKMALHLNLSVRKVLADFADKNFHRGRATRKSLDFISSIVQSSINSALFNNIWHTQHISSQGCLENIFLVTYTPATLLRISHLPPPLFTVSAGLGLDGCATVNPRSPASITANPREVLYAAVCWDLLFWHQHKPRELLELGLLSHTKYSIQKLSRK